MEYVILKQPTHTEFGAALATDVAKAVSPKVTACTVAKHTFPWLVVVYTESALSQEEYNQIAVAIQAA